MTDAVLPKTYDFKATEAPVQVVEENGWLPSNDPAPPASPERAELTIRSRRRT
jgi:hypothetical protein